MKQSWKFLESLWQLMNWTDKWSTASAEISGFLTSVVKWTDQRGFCFRRAREIYILKEPVTKPLAVKFDQVSRIFVTNPSRFEKENGVCNKKRNIKGDNLYQAKGLICIVAKLQPRHFSIRSRKFYKEIATCIFVIIRNTCNTNFFYYNLSNLQNRCNFSEANASHVRGEKPKKDVIEVPSPSLPCYLKTNKMAEVVVWRHRQGFLRHDKKINELYKFLIN